MKNINGNKYAEQSRFSAPETPWTGEPRRFASSFAVPKNRKETFLRLFCKSIARELFLLYNILRVKR